MKKFILKVKYIKKETLEKQKLIRTPDYSKEIDITEFLVSDDFDGLKKLIAENASFIEKHPYRKIYMCIKTDNKTYNFNGGSLIDRSSKIGYYSDIAKSLGIIDTTYNLTYNDESKIIEEHFNWFKRKFNSIS